MLKKLFSGFVVLAMAAAVVPGAFAARHLAHGDVPHERGNDRAREVRQTLADEVSRRNAELRERLQGQMEERVIARAESLTTRLNALNDKHTDNYLNYIDNIDRVVNIAEEQATRLELRGLDMSAVYELLDEIHEAADAAREAVFEQKAKVYAIELSDAPTVEQLRRSFRAELQELRSDHQALRQDVLLPLRAMFTELRQAFRQAKEPARSQRGEDSEEAEE